MDECNKNNNIATKSAARLVAVMSLYSFKMNEDLSLLSIDELIKDIKNSEDLADVKFKQEFAKNLIKGTCDNLEQINQLINNNLSDKWQFDRENKLVLSIIQVAIYELLELTNNPTKVIINEYIEIAKAYFDNSEPKFVNGILDSVAKIVRS